MKLEGKNEIAIVRTVEKEQKSKMSLKQIFEFLKNDYKEKLLTEVPRDSKLNKFGRSYYVFPILEKNGIDTWEKLEEESKLIDEKQSNLSSAVRDAIIHLHTHCLITKFKLEKEKSDGESGI